MIDEDRTFENEVRFNNDRLGVKKNIACDGLERKKYNQKYKN